MTPRIATRETLFARSVHRTGNPNYSFLVAALCFLLRPCVQASALSGRATAAPQRVMRCRLALRWVTRRCCGYEAVWLPPKATARAAPHHTRKPQDQSGGVTHGLVVLAEARIKAFG
jgi:hypothetical protein